MPIRVHTLVVMVLMMMVVIFVACMRSLIRLLSDGFFFFLAAIVSSIALAWLVGDKVAVIAIASLKLVDTLLELAEVKFQVFIDFTHL